MVLHPERVQCGRAAFGALLVTLLTIHPSSVLAEERGAIELDPVVLYYGPSAWAQRSQIFILGVTGGYRFGSLLPYAGGGLGFFAFQARAGVEWLPGDLEEPGPLIRLEARPQVRFGQCWEPMLTGNLGVGYRFPLERGDPGNPGTSFFVLPTFTGGQAYLHRNCGFKDEEPLKGQLLFGGTVSAGYDW